MWFQFDCFGLDCMVVATVCDVDCTLVQRMDELKQLVFQVQLYVYIINVLFPSSVVKVTFASTIRS